MPSNQDCCVIYQELPGARPSDSTVTVTAEINHQPSSSEQSNGELSSSIWLPEFEPMICLELGSFQALSRIMDV